MKKVNNQPMTAVIKFATNEMTIAFLQLILIRYFIRILSTAKTQNSISKNLLKIL